MNVIIHHIDTFFSWLLQSTAQASIVICIILILQWLLRNKLNARWHYGLWLLLLVRMLLPWAPQSPTSIFNLWQADTPQHIETIIPDIPTEYIEPPATINEPQNVAPIVPPLHRVDEASKNSTIYRARCGRQQANSSADSLTRYLPQICRRQRRRSAIRLRR